MFCYIRARATMLKVLYSLLAFFLNRLLFEWNTSMENEDDMEPAELVVDHFYFREPACPHNI